MGAHTWVVARVQHGSVPGEDDNQDQRRAGADRVDRDQERNLPIGGRAEHATRDGVIDEAADPGDETAEEKDEILPDQPVSQELGQALAETQSLHVRRF